MKTDALGVVVVRVQVPELHSGHHYLLKSALAIHRNVLVVIGDTEARLRPEDPLTYEMRQAMLKAVYPTVITARLQDEPFDDLWSKQLDLLIADARAEVSPTLDPVLYGGRDSFLQHYTGQHRTFELPPIQPVSGTEVRAGVEVRHTHDFRAGMIYASKYKYPMVYPCVDVAIVRDGQVLLGQKPTDNGRWRFIGGFVSTKDKSFEAAAKREVREETGLEPGDLEHIGSTQVDDYRYPVSGVDRLFTTFYVMKPAFGAGLAADDISDVHWFTLGGDGLKQYLVHEHHVLADMLVNFLYRGRNAR